MTQILNSTSPEQLFAEYQHLATATLYRTLGDPRKVAKSKNTEFDDLLQITYIGLWKACQTYDSSKGKFQTHAINHMRWTLIPALNNDFNILKHTQIRSNKDFTEDYTFTSMDAEVGNGENSRTLHDEIVGNEFSIDQDVTDKLQNEKMLKGLNEREKQILHMKSQDYTDMEIGEELGVTKQAVNKRYHTIIKKIQERVGYVA